MGNLDLIDEFDSIPDTVCYELEEPNLCNTVMTPNYNFRVLSMNIRSISKNFGTFLVYLYRMNVVFDVIVLTECRLDDSTIIEEIPGYTSYATKNNINQNGGVVAFIKTSWPVVVTEPSFSEACCLSMSFDNLTILGIYRSPSFKHVDNFLFSLDDNLKAHKNKQCIIVTGDINIDILESQASEYLCCYAEHGLEPVITKPTRLSACLDHIFVKTTNKAIGAVFDADITDHKIVAIALVTNSQHPKHTRNKHNYSVMFI